MNRRLIVFIAIFVVAVLSLATLVFVPQRQANIGNVVELLDDDGYVVRLNVEIADTREEHARGLMNRSSLAADAGMLFVFSGDERRNFWMDNTLIPLDMIFISKDLTIIDIHKNATPLSRESIPSSGPCRYVLEVNGGSCDAWGVDVGDSVRLDSG